MMMFDDACPTHMKNVFPALKERNLVGTYYICPDKGEYKANATFWEQQAAAEPTVVYGNHTMTHKGFTSLDHARKEIVDCNAVIERVQPGKKPRLISFAAPGGVKNAITGDEIKAIVEENGLIVRPEFGGHGAAVHYKKADQVLADIDKGAESGNPSWIIFHGVGGDWIKFDLAEFKTLLDGLQNRRDKVWITDPISVHKYTTERDATTVRSAMNGAGEIKVTLACGADPALYDTPLSLITAVPDDWKKVQVMQNKQRSEIEAKDGLVTYDASPTGGTITISPVTNVTTYAFPQEQPRSKHYELWADDQRVDVFSAGLADFATFEAAGPVTLVVSSAPETGGLEGAVVRPVSRQILAVNDSDSSTFTVPGPGHLCVDVPGKPPLFLYINTQDTPPPLSNQKVHYFAAGQVHNVGTFILKSGETMYLEGGAVVRGSIRCADASDVAIRGRGVLDGSCYSYDDREMVRSIVFEQCRDILVEGVIMINSTSWMLVLGACDGAVVRDLKQIGSYISTDGIDVCGSRNILIEDCILRNDDDNVAIKSLAPRNTTCNWEGNVENVRVRRCVLLNGQPGNSMEIGYELRAEYVKDVVFEDIDVIASHGGGAVFSIHNGDRAVVEDILWENIRIEHYWDKLIDFRVLQSRYNTDPTRGTIRNVRLKNIHIQQSIFNPGCSVSIIGGCEAKRPIEGIVLEDIKINGKPVRHLDELDLFTRHTRDVVLL